MNTVQCYGCDLRAFVGDKQVFCTSSPSEIQAVFLGVALGAVTLGSAKFSGNQLAYVAQEASRAWTATLAQQQTAGTSDGI